MFTLKKRRERDERETAAAAGSGAGDWSSTFQPPHTREAGKAGEGPGRPGKPGKAREAPLVQAPSPQKSTQNHDTSLPTCSGCKGWVSGWVGGRPTCGNMGCA